MFFNFLSQILRKRVKLVAWFYFILFAVGTDYGHLLHICLKNEINMEMLDIWIFSQKQ